VIGLSLVNGLALNTVPLINGRWQDELGLTSTQVGWLLTEQTLLAAVVGIALSTRLHRIRPRLLGLAAGAVAVAVNLAQAFAATLPALIVANAVVGLAAGCLTACAAAAIATALRVDRTSALVSIGATVIIALLTLLLGRLAGDGGRRALFLGQAAVSVGALLLTAVLPERDPAGVAGASPPLLSSLRSPVVLSSVVINIGSTGVWAFTERIGAHLGFGTARVGDILAGATVLGILGAAAAAVVARAGREKAWALAGIIAFGVANAAVGAAWSQGVYIGAMAVQAFTYVFSTPFITAVAVAKDRTGGLAAALSGWSTLLSAGAPAMAGLLVRHGSYASLAWVALAGTAVSAGALALVRMPPPEAVRRHASDA
jgi:predicted MFS family arabinose efflux permease